MAFNALMKYHNVSQAAESLSITQPSMSNALKRLRTLLDEKQVKLYDEGFSCLVAQDHPVLEQGLDLESYLKLPHVLVAPLDYQE